LAAAAFSQRRASEEGGQSEGRCGGRRGKEVRDEEHISGGYKGLKSNEWEGIF